MVEDGGKNETGWIGFADSEVGGVGIDLQPHLFQSLFLCPHLAVPEFLYKNLLFLLLPLTTFLTLYLFFRYQWIFVTLFLFILNTFLLPFHLAFLLLSFFPQLTHY